MENKILKELFQIRTLQKMFGIETLTNIENHIVDYLSNKYCIENEDGELYKALECLYETCTKNNINPTVNMLLEICKSNDFMKKFYYIGDICIETPEAPFGDFVAYYDLKDGIDAKSFNELHRFHHNHTTGNMPTKILFCNDSVEDIIIKGGDSIDLGEINSGITIEIKGCDESETLEDRNCGHAEIRISVFKENKEE